MGCGDFVMATSQVKQMYARNPLPVLVVGAGGRPQWSPAFENNPKILRKPNRRCQQLRNGPGLRPYIAGKTATHWTWRKWDIRPGEIFLSDAERAFAEPYAGRVLVEPNTKVQGGNKAWRFDRWQRFVDESPEAFIQVGAPESRRLDRVEFVETTIRQAFAVLAVSRAFVGCEGALHHAAAALGIPAVVLWSEFVDVQFTGYTSQRNIRHAGPACGSRLPCEGCKASMDAISVDEVRRGLMEVVV